MKNKKYIKILLILIIVVLIIVLINILLKKDNNINEIDKIPEEQINIPSEVILEGTENLYMRGNPGGIDIEKLDNAKVVEGEKENTSNVLLENREFEGLEFSNIKLKSINGVSKFTAIVKNNTDNVIDTKNLSLKFVDKEGNLISKLSIYIPTLGSKSTTTVDASITADIINAYNFTIENVE